MKKVQSISVAIQQEECATDNKTQKVSKRGRPKGSKNAVLENGNSNKANVKFITEKESEEQQTVVTKEDLKDGWALYFPNPTESQLSFINWWNDTFPIYD